MTKKKSPKTTEAPEVDWQAQANEYRAGWQRTQAEFENYRKRIEASHQELAQFATATALLKITPILDDFRRAFSYIPAEQAESAWIVGMHQVEKHLRVLLAGMQLTPIEDGGPFDPKQHEAIAYEDHPELPEGTVIDVVESGWKLGDKVIKPARVRVSKGKS